MDNIFKKLRKERKFSQVKIAEIFNINQATVSKWEQGKSIPDIATLKKLSEFYNVPINNLVCNDKPIYKTRIPVLGTIPAGIAIEMIEDVEDYEDLSPEMLTGGKEYFALKIRGNSMFPKYIDKDVIIVLKQDDCVSGQDCVVAVNGYDATFKKVIKQDDCIILQPINLTEFNPVIYSKKQIEQLPVRILGVAVEIRRSL